MGLSASEARFLSLTGKKSDLEFEAQQISNRRERLASGTNEVQAAYSKSINNTVLKFKVITEEGMKSNVLTYSSIMGKYADSAFSNMYLTDALGRKVVADKKDIPDGENEKEYIVDPHLLEGAYFEDTLKEGVYFISKKDTEGKLVPQSLATLPLITEEYDESDDAQAEAKYNQEMDKLQRDDKKLELELNRIESNHKAIETELQSVQKIIEKNIETSFKTFSG